MQQQSRVVVVMRHAKAEESGPTDAERELAERGRADAAAAGRWLAERGVEPEHAWVSAATRTRQTYAAVATAAGWSLDPSVDRGLYAAGPETALDLIRATPDDARTLVVVGHNPTMAYLAAMLDDGEGDEDAAGEMAAGYPTSAVTVLEYAGAWGDLDQASCRVVAFHVGRADYT
ncbi:MAG: SixA phosphatase family protein [Nocardioides sp.]